VKSTLEEVIGGKLQNKPRQAVLKASGKLEPIEYNDQIVEVIRCNECNIEHLVHENSYLEIIGNLHVGGEGRGGLLGNGDWKNIGVPVYHFCINNHCLSDYVRKIELKELSDAGQIPSIHYKSRFYTTVPLAVSNDSHIKDHTTVEVVNIREDGIRIRTDVHTEGEGRKCRELSVQEFVLQKWLEEGKLEVLPDTKEGE
jgi:hypothetical protein